MEESLLERSDPMVGRLVAGKYRIEKTMGAGGMGAVYKARHSATGGLSALKVMRAQFSDSADAIKRFHLEAQNAAALHSMHTVRVLDFGVDEELLYLVMEYLDGESLDEVLARSKVLPWRRAVAIARQVLESLWEAHNHERRIVHRDIKPPNIFLVRKVDGADFVKVIDFGIARALDATGAGTRGAIGTPHAMAPEQWRGKGVDGRTDLYAVGCVLYEMLCGRPPFLGRSDATPNELMMQLANAHISEKPEPIQNRVAGLPPALAAVVGQLLEKDPDARPASARDAIIALDRCLAAPGGESAGWDVDKAADATIAAIDLPTMGAGDAPDDVIVRHTPQSPPQPPAARDSNVPPTLPGDERPSTDGSRADDAPDDSPAVAHTQRDTTEHETGDFAGRNIATAPGEAALPAATTPKQGRWWLVLLLFLAWLFVRDVSPESTFNINYNAEEEPGSRVTVKGVRDKDKQEELEHAVEHVAEALASKVEEWTGDDDRKRTDEASLPGAASGASDSADRDPDIVYRARMSDDDHRNSKGRNLVEAHHIIAMDRANYHRFQRRDPEDQADPTLHDKRGRRVLRRLLRRGMDRDIAERIVRGTPLIEVRIWGEERAEVTIVEK